LHRHFATSALDSQRAKKYFSSLASPSYSQESTAMRNLAFSGGRDVMKCSLEDLQSEIIRLEAKMLIMHYEYSVKKRREACFDF
jgi:hypothetical protein